MHANDFSGAGAIFAEAVAAERRTLGLSQRAVCDRLAERGIALDPSGLSRIESGERVPRIDEALALAAALGRRFTSLVPQEEVSVFRQALHNASRAHQEVVEALGQLDRAQMELALTADGLDLSKHEHEAVTDWLEGGALAALEEARINARANDAAEETRAREWNVLGPGGPAAGHAAEWQRSWRPERLDGKA